MDIPTKLVTSLRTVERVAVLTGAGISAESGIPTFREAQTGLWSRFKPEELATPKAFHRYPKMVWEWYQWRRDLVSQAEPNAGHYALVAMEMHIPSFTLITQNVDGMHQRAGSQNVIELHGNIHRVKCFDEGTIVEHWGESGELPPRCPDCDGYLRPDVVWYSEPLPENALNSAWNAAQECEIFFSIGTSAIVQPAASLPIIASEHGAILVEINPNRTPLTDAVDYYLQGEAGRVLPELSAA